MMKPKAIALIPARSGSKRVPHKNIKNLEGHPILAYAIRSAIESNIFDAVLCATDSQEYADIAIHYGAEVPFLRPPAISADKSPDIEWVDWVIRELQILGRSYDTFSILRPTSPFRTSKTIQRAWNLFINNQSADSLRAVERCSQHPGKMWIIQETQSRMNPLLPFKNGDVPWHSSQYDALPEIYVQNASLEIAWTKVAIEKKSISGSTIIPFKTEGLEGFDINQPEDWIMVEHYLKNGKIELSNLSVKPYISTMEKSNG
jgi:CMP-N,N'-diacetyllegionaminic acid synthase